MANKTSVINKNTLDRISEIFPNVVWKDYTNFSGNSLDIKIRKEMYKKQSSQDTVGYFDKNTDKYFHIRLNEITSISNSDFAIVSAFYNYKNIPGLINQKTGNKTTRAMIFDYLLPPEADFKSISVQPVQPNQIVTHGGIYFFFNEFFTEKKFEDNLFADLKVPLAHGNGFPLHKNFNAEMKNWLCYYDNDKIRFNWDIEESINFGHNPNVPWEAFQYHCQYEFTLVKIGYEKRDLNGSVLDMTSYKNKGFALLRSEFSLNEKENDYSTPLNEALDYCILAGNINFGIETAPNEDVFKIKNFAQTKTAINNAKRQKKYEQFVKIFDFNDSDIASINRIYDDNSVKLNLPEISKYDFTLRFEELKKNTRLNNAEQKRIKEIADKIKNKNPLSQNYTNNDDKNEFDYTDNVAYGNWKDEEKYKLDEQIDAQTRMKELAEFFCDEFTSDEKAFTDWIKESIEKPEGITKFAAYWLNMLESKDEASESEIVTEYARLLNGSDITSIIRLLKTAKENAQNKLKEKYKEI